MRSETKAAAGAAILALIASLVVAIGPAREESARYSWPPAALPAGADSARGWYAPLPLLNRVPESLRLRVPCGLTPSPGEGTVLATARAPRRTDGLRVFFDADSLAIDVGRASLARLPWPASCPLELEVADGELRLPGRTVPLPVETLGRMPIVTGLFTELDLTREARPEVSLRTRTFATSYTWVQRLAAVLAVALALAVVILVSRREASPRLRPPSARLASLRSGVDWTDAVVIAGLLVWWVVAPVHFDDGWLWAVSGAFGDVGAVGSYFDNWGITSRFGFWLEWLRHRLADSTNDLALARLPSLLALVSAWALCRWSLPRVLGASPPAVVRWTLAGTFLVGATAWGMTIRAEPFALLLASASLAATISFVRAPRLGAAAIALVAVVLAATVHPAGIVAAAPPLVAALGAFRWLRAGGRDLLLPFGALLAGVLALAVIALTLEADVHIALAESRAFSESDYHGEPPWREFVRYTRFDENGGATAVRRLGLALLLLTLVALITRRRADDTGVLFLPARSLALGLALLAFVPSKWPAHLGVLAGLAAVAAASELARLRREREPRLRVVLALLALAVVAVWAWRAPGVWSLLDLQKVEWNDAFGVRGYGWLGVALAVGAWLGVRAWRTRSLPRLGPSPELLGWSVAVLSLAAVAVTAASLTVDAAITSWSPARQNLETLAGGDSCGLAHELTVDLADRMGADGTATLLEPPVGLYFPCARLPAIEGGLVEVPQIVVYQSSLWPVTDRDAPFAAVTELYGLEPLALGPRGVEALSVTSSIPGFVRLDAARG